MPKKVFLGQASRYSKKDILSHTFSIGTRKDSENLIKFLSKKYNVPTDHVALTRNGRSALAIALKMNLQKNSEIIINGFTCYAVVEAIRAAGMKVVYADIDKKTMHFDVKTLKAALENHPDAKAIIIQNTFGNPVNITEIEDFTRKHNLMIFEDLAHSAGIVYPDGRIAGSVGVAAAFSFGKEKSIDVISGGALILNNKKLPAIQAPSRIPKFSDVFRARFYPLFGAIYRMLANIKLEKVWMSFLLKTHQVERSANSRLDPNERPPHFIAKLALKQFKKLQKTGQKPLRNFTFVNNREELIKKLRKNGYYFDGFWFEKPIAPERFYKKANFKENECPIAVEAAKEIINIPTNYTKNNLEPALKIIKEFEK